MFDQAKEAAKETRRIQSAEQKRIQTAEAKDKLEERNQPNGDIINSGIALIGAASVEKQSLPSVLLANTAAKSDSLLSRTDFLSTKKKELNDELHEPVESPLIKLSFESKGTSSSASPVPVAASRFSVEGKESLSGVKSTSIDEIATAHDVVAVAVDPINMDAGDERTVLIGSEKAADDNQVKWLAAVLSSVHKISHPDVRAGP